MTNNRQLIILTYLILIAVIYYFSRPIDIYEVTAYCNCKICINKLGFRDKRFASMEETYFGGIAAPRRIPFGTKIRLIPLKERDQEAVNELLEGRLDYIVEDRGFLIRERRLDIFIPKRMGGHKTAQKWGTRQMRIAIESSPFKESK